MKCKAYGCCVNTDYASGYCHLHGYVVRVNHMVCRENSFECKKWGCKNLAAKGKSYCNQHDWSLRG